MRKIFFFFFLYNTAFAQEQPKLYLDFKLGGSSSFQRKVNITTPHLYSSPTLAPIVGFGIDLLYKNNGLRFVRHALPTGQTIKLRNQGSSASWANEWNYSLLYNRDFKRKYFTYSLGIGVDYMYLKDRFYSKGSGIGTLDLGYIFNEKIYKSRATYGLLSSVRMAKFYRKYCYSFTMTYRYGLIENYTANYTFFEKGVPTPQSMVQYGDNFYTTLSVGRLIFGKNRGK